MSVYTIHVQTPVPIRLAGISESDVCFEIDVDDILHSDLCKGAARKIYTDQVVPREPKVKVATDVQHIYCNVSTLRLAETTTIDTDLSSELECDILFNLQCIIPDHGNMVHIAKINAVNIVTML